jgi:predicted DNA binding CopG/RHH family protein
MKKKAGRPPKPDADKRGHVITVRLSTEEKNQIDTKVTRSGLNQSEWARQQLLKPS